MTSLFPPGYKKGRRRNARVSWFLLKLATTKTSDIYMCCRWSEDRRANVCIVYLQNCASYYSSCANWNVLASWRFRFFLRKYERKLRGRARVPFHLLSFALCVSVSHQQTNIHADIHSHFLLLLLDRRWTSFAFCFRIQCCLNTVNHHHTLQFMYSSIPFRRFNRSLHFYQFFP